MKKSLAAALIALALIAGVGTGFVVDRFSDANPRKDPPTSASPSQTPPSADDKIDAESGTFLIGPGYVGPVQAGMTVDEAVDTGWIAKDTKRAESCGLDPSQYPFYKWVGDKDVIAGLDIQVDQKGRVASIGIGDGSNVILEAGLPGRYQLGSNFLALKDSFPVSELEGPRLTDYGQVAYAVEDDGRWIGFMFDEESDTMRDSSKIAFMEVTFGRQPSLIRDGC